jgi:hypothetical protein
VAADFKVREPVTTGIMRCVSLGAANKFSAAGSALGYLAQIEYGLLLTLKRMDESVSLRVSLETADDIVFEHTGGVDARELWQSKHHLERRGSLGDASPDVWKSFHNWIESSDDDCALVLFSTVAAPADSAASLLGRNRTNEDVREAQQRLETVATAGGNEQHATYYQRFLGLTSDARFSLLSRVTILDQATRAADLSAELETAVRKTVPQNRRSALVERLRGWWHGRVSDHLTRVASGAADWIEMVEVENQLHRIALSLRDENLPLDFSDLPEPTQDEVEADDRIFVEQLQLVMLHRERVRMAIYDHNRAFLQRSRWQREDLLNPNELETYDRLLIEEWKRVFLPLEEGTDDTDQDEAALRRTGIDTYVALGQRNLPEVRPEVRSGYIPIGSLHMLADRLEIGWHRDWLDLLRHRINEAGGLPAQQGVA